MTWLKKKKFKFRLVLIAHLEGAQCCKLQPRDVRFEPCFFNFFGGWVGLLVKSDALNLETQGSITRHVKGANTTQLWVAEKKNVWKGREATQAKKTPKRRLKSPSKEYTSPTTRPYEWSIKNIPNENRENRAWKGHHTIEYSKSQLEKNRAQNNQRSLYRKTSLN